MKKIDTPVIGAMAHHHNGLQPRMVTKVSEDKSKVWLRLLAGERGPFHSSNYDFYRFERVEL